jgi:hypothetical protein
MDTIGGISIDELKKDRLSNKDIEFILETSALYKETISAPGMVTVTHEPASVISIANTAFQAGIACGIARGKKLTRVTKKFGFTPSR